MAIAPGDGISKAEAKAATAAAQKAAATKAAATAKPTQTPYNPLSGMAPAYVAPIPYGTPVPNFTPTIKTPTVQPGTPGFVGPVAPTTPTTPSSSKEPVPPVPPVPPTNFPKVGTLLRYDAGSKVGYRIPVYADGAGGEFKGEESINPVEPGSTGFTTGTNVTLARNTFANTMALLVGETEATQPWVDEMYNLMQGFINTGSSIEEAQNLALREAKNKGTASKFVQRFAPIFKLQDRLNAGETVQVPSIAEYVRSEQKLGEVFRAAGLGELATREMAAKILGDANKSVDEATSLIADVFNAIDNAPKQLKDDLATYFPGADRTSVAKALLLGKEGAVELTKKVKGIEQLSAAKSQKVDISLETGMNLAAGGADYASSLNKFAEVNRLSRAKMLGQINRSDFTQEEAIASVFESNAAADEKLRMFTEAEKTRFSGKSGMASQRRGIAGQL